MTKNNFVKYSAVALGNFDGMHIGHMAVLNRAKSFEKTGLTPVAVLFDEHSRKLIEGSAPPMLTLPQERDKIISKNGLKIVTLPFAEIKQLSPAEFVEEILIKQLHAAVVCCGFNYRFGKNAVGDAEMMNKLCRERGIDCCVVDEVDFEGQPVSSTEIRSLIENGQIEKANRILGRSFGFCSTVIDGDKRGRKLGFPTINQEIPSELVLPKFGVYETAVTVLGKKYKGITNIGKRPTVGTDKILGETHILDFSGNIYGETVDIRLKRFIRPEKKFSSFEELARQIEADKREVL